MTETDTRASRARLKIFFGASSGVGKTYTMLEEARQARLDGDDIVLGLVETHGRPELDALLAGLPIVAPRAPGELDLEGALARRPARILIDALAHTNASGSKHVKRWHDVIELLEAGIDVHTTLNVEHVESLSDVVQQITGIEVRETVPDAVLARADEIELVDISPEELLERVAEGKVETVFERGTLLALRELALRRTAERVDDDILEYRREHAISAAWPTSERILVAVGASPASERLIRATKRIAAGLHADWTAAHVEVLGAAPLSDKDRDRVENHLRLAESLGADIERLAGVSVAECLLAHARAHNVTRIVAGKPTHSRWRDLVRGSLLDKLIRGSGSIEIHVISPLEAGRPPRSTALASEQNTVAYVSVVGLIAVVTAIGFLVADVTTFADITMLYLIAIAIASLFGRGPSLLASTLAVAAFNFCFVPPRFTFGVTDTRHLLTFAVMFGAGLVISTLTGRLRRQQRDAVTRERNTAGLLAFTRDIGGATTVGDVAAVTVRHLEDTFPIAASVMVPDPDSPGELTSAAGLMPLAHHEQVAVGWAFEHAEAAGMGTDTLPDARVLAVPLLEGDLAVGVIAVQARQDPRRRGGAALAVLETFARQAGLALGRVRSAQDVRDAALRVRTEELRSSLLSAVSHDLRTPLAVITGAATTLRDDADRLSVEARAELLGSIVDDAQRLERVLGNLLQLTRVESGLVPAREWISVEELVGAALTRLEDAIGDRDIVIEVPHDLLIPVDPVLFEQVLINLIDNAVKHGAPPFDLHARRQGAMIEIDVRDHGRGVPAGSETRLFEKFERASTAPGAGLGLAVVRAIVQAHGGTVAVTNAVDGGARFRIELPAEHAGTPRPMTDALAALPVREVPS